MKKATVKTTAIPHRSFWLSHRDGATVEKRFILPVRKPVTLVKSESTPSRYHFWSSVSLSLSKGREEGHQDRFKPGNLGGKAVSHSLVLCLDSPQHQSSGRESNLPPHPPGSPLRASAAQQRASQSLSILT